MTLIEAMVGVVVGLIVSGAMLAMMANTLGTSTRTIEMARLSQELRSVLQLVTRDVRRSSYNAEAIRCFSNIDCGSDGTFANGLPGDITINSVNRRQPEPSGRIVCRITVMVAVHLKHQAVVRFLSLIHI